MPAQEQQTTHTATHTTSESNAFPVASSIIAGLLSLILVRFLIGLAPIPYELDLQTAEFYFRGKVISASPPSDFCFTGRMDLLPNFSQLLFYFGDSDSPFPPETNKTFNFLSFRSFRSCSEVFDGRYSADRIPTHRIGFVGVGATLLPISEDTALEWLRNETRMTQKEHINRATRLLPYFVLDVPEADEFALTTHDIFEISSGAAVKGTCTFSGGHVKDIVFDQVQYNAILAPCRSEEPKEEECSAAKQRAQEFLEQAKLRAERAKTEDISQEQLGGRLLSTTHGMRLALYTRPFKGRAIYYAVAELLDKDDYAEKSSGIEPWAREFCESAEVAAQALSAEKAERGIIGWRSDYTEDGSISPMQTPN